jgi:hypothetical protein
LYIVLSSSVTTHSYAIKHVKGTLYLCFNARQQVDLRDARRVGVKADKAEKVIKLLERKRGAVLNR